MMALYLNQLPSEQLRINNAIAAYLQNENKLCQ